MTTAPKHTPATPLPWSVAEYGPPHMAGVHHFSIKHRDTTVANLYPDGRENAAYIAHACNEYPKLVADRAKLVEALRHLEKMASTRDRQAIEDALTSTRARLRSLEEE